MLASVLTLTHFSFFSESSSDVSVSASMPVEVSLSSEDDDGVGGGTRGGFADGLLDFGAEFLAICLVLDVPLLLVLEILLGFL